ncbi:MAG: alpha/beta hydrolase [Alphaproteobacteria bacterium]|nr:alpha/beta hydrolase [Alphaproteobacteria bacterium]
MTWTTLPRSNSSSGLAWHQRGSGPAVVLIHGVGLRAESWGGILPGLATRHNVYALDLPGHGDSPLLDKANPTVTDYTDQIAASLQDIPGPVSIAGHSLGALISLDLAARYREKIHAVAALNSIYRRSPDSAQAVRARANSLTQAQSGRDADPQPTLTRWFGNPPSPANKAANDACYDWLVNGSLPGYAAAYNAFAYSDGPDDAALEKIACPALLLTAAGDPNSTPEMSKALARIIPKGSAHIIEDAAHMAPMTHAKMITNILAEFFAMAEGEV